MSTHNEMTRHAFISHVEAYMKQLMLDPLHAKVDDFLLRHGMDNERTLKSLLKRTDEKDENSAILTRNEVIKDNGYDDKGNRLKDTFKITYKIPRKDYVKKLRNLYISLFESNIVDGCPINEEDGALTADASGQFIQPLFGDGKNKKTPIKRNTVYITSEQMNYIKNMINEDSPNVMDTQAGDFGYDAPIGNKNDDFYKEANDHKDMMKKSWKK